MRNFVQKATRRLGKRRMETVEFVKTDCGADTVYMVGLKDGWVSAGYGETIWQFGQEHLDYGSTEKEMFDDMMNWFSTVEYREEGPHRFA